MNAGLTLNADLVLILVGTVIPLAVGVVTKLASPSWLKSVLLIVLGTVATAIAVSVSDTGTAVISKATIIDSIHTIVQSVAIYYGVWKPTGVSAKVNTATANFGI